MSLDSLIQEIREFNEERDWDQFHSPKNLAMALSVEVAEIAEHFQWLTQEQSKDPPRPKLAEIRDEIGDTMIFVLTLADKLGIDPVKAAHDKLQKNRAKYPSEKVRGKHLKYTEYE